MKVNIYDPYLSNNNFENGLNFCSCLDEMLINADIISLHAPLTDQTRHIICGSTIAKMKRGAIVINTSRGGLINEKDLYDALVSQKISAAALDVFETEPIDIHNKLLDLSNVIATPHIGGSTVESLEKVAYMAGQEIREFLETGKSKFIVNFSSLITSRLNHFFAILFSFLVLLFHLLYLVQLQLDIFYC